MYRISLTVLTLALLVSLALGATVPSSAASYTLDVMSWNVESGGADPMTIYGQIAAFNGIDLWGLSEVNGDDDAQVYEHGAEFGEKVNFSRVVGTTGGGDRLVALYDEDRFDLLGAGELADLNIGAIITYMVLMPLVSVRLSPIWTPSSEKMASPSFDITKGHSGLSIGRQVYKHIPLGAIPR